MKRKLLAARRIEFCLSFLRLLSIIGFGVLAAYSLFGIISIFGLGQKSFVIFLALAFLCFVSKYPLTIWRKRINFLIDNFEDTAKYAKRKKKYGEYDEDGNLNIGLMLKRGSEDAIGDLNKLIGLEHVKQEVLRMESVYEFEKQQHKKTESVARHLAFLGNPGCGKTEVASIFSGLLYKYGRIKYNMYLQCTGNDLTGEFPGQTKSKVDAIFKLCRGGVLFIDEAYILGQSYNGASSEAIAQLLVHMESEKNTVVIFAGYSKEMEDFIKINPGLASRISTTIEFPDYNARELVQITKKFMAKKNISISPDAEKILENIYQEKIDLHELNFSNGRYARNCFDEIYQQHALLYQQRGKELGSDANIISVSDIISIKDKLLIQS